jgi:glycosyltransferase involved in cell wall biosynthesis
LQKHLGQIQVAYELLLIENGSHDSTFDEISRISSESTTNLFKTYAYKSNRGLGAALRLGVEKSRGDWIIFMADDLPFGFQEIDEAVLHQEEKGYYILSKYYFSNIRKRKLTRTISGLIFAFLRESILRTKVRDSQGSFFGRAEIVKGIFRNCSEEGFLITTEALFVARRFGFEVKEIPVIQIFESERGKSTITIKDILQMFQGLFRIAKKPKINNKIYATDL